MIMSVASAVIGTIALSILVGVPSCYYLYCGAVGGVGWLVYMLARTPAGLGEGAATFLATMTVLLLSRFVAIWKRCPVTVFLVAGIFPLVPGAGIYWTAYYIVMNQLQLAAQTGYEAAKIAVAIVLGIIFIFEIPQGFFLRILRGLFRERFR